MGILLGRFREFAQSGAPLKLDDAYAALTNGQKPQLNVENVFAH